MKAYLVGGAVRDQLLGYPIRERDWVVTGSTPEQMLQQGYQQVGKDFPVFLHPATREEYALARTERKSGLGYYGFVCNYHPKVSLTEDLLRRDLTINAMAMDKQGQLIDPYGGLQDLQNRLLRHVSPAFLEDPVRVLRVARFAARYYHLGFRLADETKALMYQMVKRGELANLVAERVWQEWQRSLTEKNPEVFITTLRACGALAIILPELDALFGVPNPPRYHPEVDSGIHSLMVLQAAVDLSIEPEIRFAALVHDLGKALTPLSQWPKHQGHEENGVAIVESLCQRLRIPTSYRQIAVIACRYHLTIHRVQTLDPTTRVKLLEQVDAFRRPQQFANLLLVCEADAQGCGQLRDYPQRAKWQEIYKVSSHVAVQPLINVGYQGQAIKEALHKQRVQAVQELINS